MTGATVRARSVRVQRIDEHGQLYGDPIDLHDVVFELEVDAATTTELAVVADWQAESR